MLLTEAINGVRPGAGNVEHNRLWPGVVVRIINRLPQRASATVQGIGRGKNCPVERHGNTDHPGQEGRGLFRFPWW